jgi:hypothetical protein
MRAMPENEKPPARPVDVYSLYARKYDIIVSSMKCMEENYGIKINGL